MKCGTATRRLLRFRILFPVFSLLLILPMVLWFATAKSRHVSVEVQGLVRELPGYDAENQLIALAPKKYGELRRILLLSDPWYSRVWNGLPPFIRDELPDPGERAKLRDKLQLHLKDAGPVICRAMTGAICTALESGDSTENRAALLSALAWSIPESERAVTTLSNLLVSSTNSLFGYIYDVKLSPKVPHLAPLLAQALRNEDMVVEAASGLGHLGTNSAFALPLLVEVAEKGVANARAQPNVNISRRWGVEPVSFRRSVALRALAEIGITNSAVIGVLNKAAEAREDDLCSAAYLAALRLEVPIAGNLQAWAESWNPIEADQWNPDDANFPPGMAPARIPFSYECQILSALGNMGSKASPAVSLLTRIASTARTNRLPHLDDSWSRQAVEMRLVAISSLYKIDPQQAAPFVQFVLENSRNSVAVDLLSTWQEMRGQIVPAFVEQLQNPAQQLAAAFILHGVAPDLEEPRRVLEAAMLAGHPQAQATAMNWLWRLRQDADEVLPAARALLTTSNGNAIRSALNVLEQMGERARPAVPEIKTLLTSKNSAVRDRAGQLLRHLSPADMPSIIE